MKKCNKVFLQKLGYDEDIPILEAKIYSPVQINEIVADYGLHGSYQKGIMSIADIVGYEYGWRNIEPNIFKSLDSFFDRDGDGYHSRSVGLLDYSTDELLEVLKPSYYSEPIKVSEIDEGKYVVSGNGLHRFTVLKCHFLQDCLKANSEEELERLREKYTIPVSISHLSYEKTYSNFLNSFFDLGLGIRSEYDSNYETTGNVIVSTKNEEKFIFDDNSLIDYINSSIDADIVDTHINELKSLCTRYDSLRKFFDERIPVIGNKISNKGVEVK